MQSDGDFAFLLLTADVGREQGLGGFGTGALGKMNEIDRGFVFFNQLGDLFGERDLGIFKLEWHRTLF